MALVDQHDREFYEVLEIVKSYEPWVEENVVPHLNKKAVSYSEFQEKLNAFLSDYEDGFTLIADWPDDLRYFLQTLIIGKGQMMGLPFFQMKMMREIYPNNSAVPHSALYDARAVKENYNGLKAKN